MSTASNAPVVIGYDGSDGARLALAWAGDEAARRRAPVEVVVAVDWRPFVSPGVVGSLYEPPDLRAVGDRVAEDGVARLHAQHPGLIASSTVQDWTDPLPALVAASTSAQLVVVGSRGTGRFTGLLLGSTGAELAARAHCPVVVVRSQDRGQPQAPGGSAGAGVVVGVDASAESAQAVAFALSAAAARGVGLTAIHAWDVPSLWGEGADRLSLPDLAVIEQEETLLLGELLAGAGSVEPDVDVHHLITQDHPVAALVEASQDAELLVVGSRGRGGFRGLLLGSVSRGVLAHAGCAVAVVHGQR